MLLSLRIACAGGCTPLMVDDDETNTSKNKKKAPTKKKKKRRIYSASEDESKSVEEAPPSPPKPVSKKAQPKKPEVFTEFSFRSKFTVLIEELKKIQDNEPDSKSLVFSQFVSSLKFLQEELTKHGLKFTTLSGDMSLSQRSAALDAFQHDPDTKVFLLTMRAGAVGINLTNANRVFLLEPALNPSFESQAVGRVYRLGQSRPVEIVHLHVKDNIETRISQLVEHKFPRLASTDSSHGETAAAPLMDRANVPVTGSMRTDTASIFEDEFDF